MPRPAVDERLPALRPLTVGQVVDGGYRGLRSRPGVVLGAGAVFLVPVAVVGALAGGGLVGGIVTRGSSLGTVANGFGTSAAAFGMGLPLARLVVAAADGWQIGLRDAFRLPARVWASAAVAWALLTALKVVGSAFLVPTPILVVLGLVVAPVVAVEQLGPIAALRRGMGLAGRAFWRCTGVVVLQVIATLGIGAALLAVPASLLAGAGDELARPVGALLQLAVSLVVMPTAALSAALAYVDLRIRVEGVDLDREVRRLQRTDPAGGGTPTEVPGARWREASVVAR